MNYPKDLNLFRLNEDGKPLAEPLAGDWMRSLYRDLMETLGEVGFGSKERTYKEVETIARRIRRFYKVYRSPFDPSRDLVGERALFEGFRVKHDYTSMILCPQGFRMIFGKRYLKIDNTAFGTHGLTFKLNIPQTLSHFIQDCNRAGIPLVWTPYGIRQLLGMEGGDHE